MIMPVNTKLVLPVVLGLSLVTVTAFVAYYVLKKDEEQSEEETIKTSKIIVVEIEVQKKIVPALIGRNGSNIKDISSKSGAIINFRKFSDKDYDVCIIRGPRHAAQLAETMVREFIRQQPDIVEDTIAVPGWACGRIIGTGGDNINDISHRSGARVKIEPAGDSNQQKQVSFRGTKEQIEVAKGLINNCVSQEKCRREIAQAKQPRLAPSPPPAPREDHTGDIKHAKCKRPEMIETSEALQEEEAATSSIEVYVSAVSSPSRFWVQFVGPQVAQLDELVTHMTEYYGNRDNRSAHALRSVAVGQVVAAVFRHDGRWYRARVHDIRPNEFDATQQVADVFYLDYGDSEYVATHELCELRADLLRLRFQAMECFLAGVKPAGEEQRTAAGASLWPKWQSQAVERFEELTQVARWKPLLSKTCTYKKTMAVGEKEKEIPGIKLFDNTDEGSIDIGEVLIAEGWAVASTSPRPSPPPHSPHTPFGDLSNSRVLGMLEPGRASSVPKDHKDDKSGYERKLDSPTDSEKLASKSLQSVLEPADKLKSISNFDLSYQPETVTTQLNGSNDFIAAEKKTLETEVPHTPISAPGTPIHTKSPIDDLKANMNRIDSHHSNLDLLGRHEK